MKRFQMPILVMILTITVLAMAFAALRTASDGWYAASLHLHHGRTAGGRDRRSIPARKPGQIAIDKTTFLDSNQLSDVEHHLEHARFWDSPTKDGHDGLDGDQLIVEGVQGGRYQIVDRWEPDPEYTRLCRFILDLTAIRIQKAWERYHSDAPSARTTLLQ